MTDEPAEDPLVAEVQAAWGAEWKGVTHPLPGDVAVLRFAASITVHRLRRAGISDLVIVKALVDDGWEKKEAAQAEG